jgi:N-acetylglucosaminyldiphosphoundecaprenol N-acetyl-beta-D-mannosaminyltransferase
MTYAFVNRRAAPHGKGRGLALEMQFDCTDVVETAELIARPPAGRRRRARLYITPNIQHVATVRHDPELRDAILDADLVTCDGFPLAAYAKFSGCPLPGRVTGREVAEHLMLNMPLSSEHGLYFLVDSVETADAIHAWQKDHAVVARVVVEVAPPRFGEDEAAAGAFADRVRAADTTILFLGLGAPKSERFANRYRTQIGDCWALCIGQSIRVALGIVQRPPAIWVRLRMEWAWRILQEPRRLTSRYIQGAIGFSAAVLHDLRSQGRIGT